jgi:hypothetical protein
MNFFTGLRYEDEATRRNRASIAILCYLLNSALSYNIPVYLSLILKDQFFYFSVFYHSQGQFSKIMAFYLQISFIIFFSGIVACHDFREHTPYLLASPL